MYQELLMQEILARDWQIHGVQNRLYVEKPEKLTCKNTRSANLFLVLYLANNIEASFLPYYSIK